MTGILAKILWALVSKMLTERFLGTLVVEGLSALSNKTENKFDDRVVKALAEALNVPQEVKSEEKKS